jgi:hypothetical protein
MRFTFVSRLPSGRRASCRGGFASCRGGFASCRGGFASCRGGFVVGAVGVPSLAGHRS